MTLKEKFYKESIEKPYVFPLDEYEQIADDYAVEFAEWISKLGFKEYSNGWGRLWDKVLYNTKELLEIYKKEKGL